MEIIADNAFHIEKSGCYTKLKDCIKTVELIRAKGDNLMFIEAKSSFPNPKDSESIVKFQSGIDDICDKFIHSLNLYASIAIGVNEEPLPDFKPANKVSLKFILIINNFEHKWCRQIANALTNQLRKSDCIAKIWKPEVLAINSKTAAKYNLII